MKGRLDGGWGEALALAHLRNEGYKPIAMCYMTRFGEIDLIVGDKNYIVFVEVKTRKSANFAEAREFVDAKKQRRVKMTAALWLIEHEDDRQPRFDVIEIYAPEGEMTPDPTVNHIEDAFS